MTDLKWGAKANVKDGDFCKAVKVTHAGKSGIVKGINTSKGGNVTIAVVQESA